MVRLLAASGVVFKCFFTDRLQILSTVVYVLMGWLALVAIRPLLCELARPGFLWLLAGRLCYTLGVVFCSWRRQYSHPMWQLFVLAGSVCHFVAIFRYVLPPPDRLNLFVAWI